MSKEKKPNGDNLGRRVAVVPNGMRMGADIEGEMLTIDFLGALDSSGDPMEIIGTYAFSFKHALRFAEQIKETLAHVSES